MFKCWWWKGLLIISVHLYALTRWKALLMRHVPLHDQTQEEPAAACAVSPPWGLRWVEPIPPRGANSPAPDVCFHRAADWGSEITAWTPGISRDHCTYIDMHIRIEEFPSIHIYIIFVLHLKVTVDPITLQTMESIGKTSVSQDALGNTTIIYEQC